MCTPPKVQVPANQPLIEVCSILFRYDSETGNLYKREVRRNRDYFPIGKPDKLGYRVVRIGGKVHQVHRIIWGMHHGDPGKNTVEMADGNPLNTRIGNLRLATRRPPKRPDQLSKTLEGILRQVHGTYALTSLIADPEVAATGVTLTQAARLVTAFIRRGIVERTKPGVFRTVEPLPTHTTRKRRIKKGGPVKEPPLS